MDKVVIKITEDERDLIQARARILNYNNSDSSVKLEKSNIKFSKKSKYDDMIHALITGEQPRIHMLKEIEYFKNQTMEVIMSKEKNEVTGIGLLHNLSIAVEEATNEGHECFGEKKNKSAGVRLRKKLKEINELNKALKVKSLQLNK